MQQSRAESLLSGMGDTDGEPKRKAQLPLMPEAWSPSARLHAGAMLCLLSNLYDRSPSRALSHCNCNAQALAIELLLTSVRHLPTLLRLRPSLHTPAACSGAKPCQHAAASTGPGG